MSKNGFLSKPVKAKYHAKFYTFQSLKLLCGSQKMNLPLEVYCGSSALAQSGYLACLLQVPSEEILLSAAISNIKARLNSSFFTSCCFYENSTLMSERRTSNG